MTEPAHTYPPTALSLWRARLGFNQPAAARALGVTVHSYQIWERGFTFDTKEPVPYQRRVLLAAAAVEAGLAPLAAHREQPDLGAWRRRMGFERSDAAEALGVSAKRYQEWEIGFDYTLKKSIDKIDLRTWLACTAIEHGVAEISLLDDRPPRAVPPVRRASTASVAARKTVRSAAVAVAVPVTPALPVAPPKPQIPEAWSLFYCFTPDRPIDADLVEEIEDAAVAEAPH